MSQIPKSKFRKSLDKILLDLSHPFLVIVTFLLSPVIITNSRALMVVHIVKGLDNFKLYAIIATIGLVLISVSYFLFWRNFNPRSSTLNMVGAICLVVSFKIAQMSDEGNLDSRNFYIGIASFASAIPIGLFLAYNFPYRIKKII